MSGIIDAIERLHDLRHLEPASKEQIHEAEKRIGIKFDAEYKEYLVNYGAISSRELEMTGISTSKRMNVADVTLVERESNYNIPDDTYVVENIGIDGAMMLQSKDGEVFIIQPGTKPQKKYSSLSEFINDVIED